MEIRIFESDRPNPDLGTDSEEFYVKTGRFCIGAGFNSQHSAFIGAADTNAQFFFDNQWQVQEDLDSFFKDENDHSRGRIKVTKNFIKPLIIRYLGNARIMDITFESKNVGTKAITRREEKLAELVYYTKVAEVATPELKQVLKQGKPIGDSENETKEIFENIYVDDFVEAINALLKDVRMINDFPEMQVDHAMHLAFSGYCGAEYTEQAGEFIWDPVLPEELFFDHSARRKDLQDGEFIGRWKLMLPSEIFERNPTLDAPTKKALKESVVTNGYDQIYGGRVPVFRVYFRGTDKIKFGYVKDEFGETYLEKIDYVYDGEEKPRFTERDLVSVKELNADQKKLFKGKNVYMVEPEIIKFVEFIPSEIIPGLRNVNSSNLNDIVLAYGVYPHQDTEYMKPMEAKFPIKSSCWLYYRGYIDTPINSLINPQRMINRYESIKEQRVNSYKGPAQFIDEDAVAGSSDSFDTIQTNMYQNKMSRVRARGMGIQNVVSSVGVNIGSDINLYVALKEDMRVDMDRMIGDNDSIKGENQGQNKLVGVMKQEIQQGSLIQEPFYGALISLYKQMYQCSANVGKRVYINNKHRLIQKMGDKYAKVIELSEEFNTEDVRVEIRRVPNLDQTITYTNQVLDAYLTAQIITKEMHANLYNRSTVDDLARALRVNAGQQAVIQKEQAKAQGVADQQAAIEGKAQQGMAQNQQDQATLLQLSENEKDRQVKLATKKPVKA